MPKPPVRRPRAVVDWKSRQREIVVRTPAMQFKTRIQKSIRPFIGPKPIWETISRLGNCKYYSNAE